MRSAGGLLRQERVGALDPSLELRNGGGRRFARRFKGGIAESSFGDLLRKHPEAVPYSRLAEDHKEWLVLNGYFDPSLAVTPPSTKGLLD